MPTKIVVPETPERTAEVIADDIASIAEGVRKLRAGRLTDKALVLLLSEASGVNRSNCFQVLDALATLDKKYLKPDGKGK